MNNYKTSLDRLLDKVMKRWLDEGKNLKKEAKDFIKDLKKRR